MPAEIVQQIARAREHLAKLEADLRLELARLPKTYGFDSVDAFIAAAYSAAGIAPKRARGRAVIARRSPIGKIRKRARITDEIRLDVKRLIHAGKTGAEIAAAVGISRPSVHNIKKALGLVGSRKR